MWDLIVSVPEHCLSFYFVPLTKEKKDRSLHLVVQIKAALLVV